VRKHEQPNDINKEKCFYYQPAIKIMNYSWWYNNHNFSYCKTVNSNTVQCQRSKKGLFLTPFYYAASPNHTECESYETDWHTMRRVGGRWKCS
jgi:hypothetical protein